MKKYTLLELAQLTSSTLIGDKDHTICQVASLDNATQDDASFLSDSFLLQNRYQEALKNTQAGLVCISPNETLVDGKNYLVSDNPSKTFQTIIKLLAKNVQFTGFKQDNLQNIHPDAKIEKSSFISPFAVVDQNVSIGKNCYIAPHVYIGPNSTIKDDCIIHPGVIIRENVRIGSRVIIQPNAVIGSCGFGYETSPVGKHEKIDQIGEVILEDDVEIGANSVIDRARFSATIIRKGTKIDNLVQVAHNCDIGPHNLIAAQTGIAGSAKTGSHVFCGGQVGIVGHVKIASQTKIATRAGISKSLKSGTYRGSPAMPIEKYHRQKVFERKIEPLMKQVKELELKLQQLEEKIK